MARFTIQVDGDDELEAFQVLQIEPGKWANKPDADYPGLNAPAVNIDKDRAEPIELADGEYLLVKVNMHGR